MLLVVVDVTRAKDVPIVRAERRIFRAGYPVSPLALSSFPASDSDGHRVWRQQAVAVSSVGNCIKLCVVLYSSLLD